MAFKTRPNQWLHDNGGKVWAKLIRLPEHIDLAQNGGYTFATSWIGFTNEVLMPPGSFLVAASEYPAIEKGENVWKYQFVLLQSLAEGIKRVSEVELFGCLYATMDKGGVIPAAKTASAVGNWLYMAAVYCRVAMDKQAATSPAAAVAAAAAVNRKRMITKPSGLAKPAAAAPVTKPVKAEPEQMVTPPKLPPPPPVPRNLPRRRVPIPAENFEVVDHIDYEDPFAD